jgi:hypothetical protein
VKTVAGRQGETAATCVPSNEVVGNMHRKQSGARAVGSSPHTPPPPVVFPPAHASALRHTRDTPEWIAAGQQRLKQ